ncbi:MAG TPA: hypothetical protein VEJ20_06865 [Candidatus Eremiobacteraceae bacterium]|nr:hypothetical protein [Candidatus Eremiobacteraceae bacterium]
MGFEFGTVYVKGRSQSDVSGALSELMIEAARKPVRERGLEPTPDEHTSSKEVRSFAVLPVEDDWVAVLEDGHPLDDGGVAEGLSDLLQTEALHFVYSDSNGEWSYEMYWEGQPLEAGGADDDDFDVSAADFVEHRLLPHFGVYYEEVAAAAGEGQPALSGSLGFIGNIAPRVPIGTEILTFRGKPPKREES